MAINRFGWLKVSPSDFLDDITLAVPFIQKDGNEYKWVHKSFMEYFSSCFICYDNKEFEQEYFRKMLFNQTYYYNVLDFSYELDTLNFRKYVILPYIKQFVDKYDMYFVSDFYNDHDKQYLRKAKYLLAITNHLTYSIHSGTDMVDKRIINLEDIGHPYSMGRIGKGKVIVLEAIISDSEIYAIIEKKMPKLFETAIPYNIHIYELEDEILNNYELNTIYNFDDAINNPMNSSKVFFHQLVDKLISIVSSHFFILSYVKCKELLKEIEAESNSDNNSLFG